MINTNSPNVLIADKYEAYINLMEEYLSQKGFTCFTTDTIEGIFKILDNKPIDVINPAIVITTSMQHKQFWGD